MASQNEKDNSLENEHIKLLHEKILQENNHFSLTQLSQRANNARNDQKAPRHLSNTKIQRMKPSSTAPAATTNSDMDPTDHHDNQAQPLMRHATFHGLPLDLDGDTQPMPSQFYKNFTSGLGADDDTQFDDANALNVEQETPQIDLMQHWQQPTYHEISSDNEDEQDEGQYFLSSVNRPAFPKTPATAVQRRNQRGDIIPSTTSTKTPGSGGLSAFGFANTAPLTGTQLFQATQAPSSPVPDVPRSDPVLSRPSPNIRHSSPGPHLNFSSPLKNLVHSPSRSVNMAGRLSRPSTRDGVHEEEHGENEWEHHHGEGFSLEEDVHDSPGSDSMDEYDEFAQEIRPSQRQQSSSPHSDKSDAENDHVDSSSRTSIHSSQRPLHLDVPYASAPSGRQHSSHQLPATQPLNHDAESADYAIADSQPTRQETQPPPALVEPSSMSSIVPGSYPLSQTTQHLNAVKRDANDSSSIPRPPPATSQTEPETHSRLPSSPPQLPAISEESEKEDLITFNQFSLQANGDAHAAVSSQLPGDRHIISQRTAEMERGQSRQGSNVPETDPADGQQTSHPQQQRLDFGTDISNEPFTAVPVPSQISKHRASQLQAQNPSQSSALTAESPRKAAGILNFAEIATDPTPPDATKDFDLNVDLLSNDDHDFMDIMSSPPAKKMRLYGKRAKAVDKTRSHMGNKSPVKASVRSVAFHDEPMPEENQHTADSSNAPDADAQELQPGRISEANSPAKNAVESAQLSFEGRPENAVPSGPVQKLPDRTTEPAQEETAAAEVRDGELQERQNLSLAVDTVNPTTPTIGEQEQSRFPAAASARDALLARRKNDIKTPDRKSSPGRLTRPKRRTSEHSQLRTPLARRNEVVEAPRSKLSHVERVSPGEHEQQKTAANEDESSRAEVQPQQNQTDITAQTPQHRRTNTDVTMADAAPQNDNTHDANVSGNTEARLDVTQPDRVLALFKGTGQAYYPATCLGAATLDGQKLRIRFDDGTITQLDASLIRRLELRRGDQVKVDLQGMRSKIYTVIGFQDTVQDAPPDSYPKTDIHGNETIQLIPKDRDSTTTTPRVETSTLLKVPVTNIYLTQTMWIRFEGRKYFTSTTSMTTIVPGNSSRAQTPVLQHHTTPATPASRSRRGTFTSNHSWSRPDLASPLPSGRGVFAGMAFAVSYTADTPEKDRVLELIQAHGGLTLEKGFDELFDVRDLGDTADEAQTPSSTSSTDNDALVLSSRSQSLGFVALIADKHSRRAKYVQALALSLPCLSGRWILDSVAANTPLSWPRYLLPAGESAFLSGAVRSRTLNPYSPTTAKLANTIATREKLLQGGKVLLVSAAGRKWEARRAYAFLTLALGASTVRRVSGLESAKRVLDAEKEWSWVYVEGSVEEAEKSLFCDGAEATKKNSRKRKRDGTEKEGGGLIAVGKDGRVRIVGDEFVVQSLILGDLMM